MEIAFSLVPARNGAAFLEILWVPGFYVSKEYGGFGKKRRERCTYSTI